MMIKCLLAYNPFYYVSCLFPLPLPLVLFLAKMKINRLLFCITSEFWSSLFTISPILKSWLEESQLNKAGVEESLVNRAL